MFIPAGSVAFPQPGHNPLTIIAPLQEAPIQKITEGRLFPIRLGAVCARAGPWWLPGLALLLTVIYVAAPYGKLASALYLVATFYAALAVALAWYCRPALYGRTAWVLMALALGLGGVGHAVWYWLDLRGLEPLPSLADAFYLAIYPFFIAALWLLGRRGEEGYGTLIDALVVGVSAAVLGWTLLIAPYIYDPDLGLAQLLVTTAYPVADLALLPLILNLVFLHRTRNRAHIFLLLGMLAYLAADLLYAHGTSVGWYAPGGLTDGLWLVAYTLFIAAAWDPSATIEPQNLASSAKVAHRRVIVLGAATVLVPAVMLFQARSHPQMVEVAAIGSILLFLLVMYRMAGLLRKTHEQAEALEHLSRTDPLTGAANRRYLEEELAREMARAQRTQEPLSLGILDLDNFKTYNDTYGHNAGDALLQELVAEWRPLLRPTDILTRYGGEEFVVLIPDSDIDRTWSVMERLRQRIPHGQTCSAGVTTWYPGETFGDFLGRADRALYRAKTGGRNQVVVEA